jgi:hypothetical protein
MHGAFLDGTGRQRAHEILVQDGHHVTLLEPCVLMMLTFGGPFLDGGMPTFMGSEIANVWLTD